MIENLKDGIGIKHVRFAEINKDWRLVEIRRFKDGIGDTKRWIMG